MQATNILHLAEQTAEEEVTPALITNTQMSHFFGFQGDLRTLHIPQDWVLNLRTGTHTTNDLQTLAKQPVISLSIRQ